MKKISLKNFVEGYTRNSTDNLKNAYLKKNINAIKYISFVKKDAIADSIIKACFRKSESNSFQFDSVTKFLLTTMVVIDEYTNIDVDFGDLAHEYDLLEENGIMEVLINIDNPSLSIINIDDYISLQTIIQMKYDDFIMNEMNTKKFIENQIERVSDILNVMLSPMIDKLIAALENVDDKTLEKIGNKISKFIK